jgi:hypothetical protein
MCGFKHVSNELPCFGRVLPMTMENLAIAQHQDTLHYAIVLGGGYRPWVWRFELKDYVYLQQTTWTTLDVTITHVILHVWKVLPSRTLLMLEG